MMARVRSVMRSETEFGSRQKVWGLMSAKMGVAPIRETAPAVAKNVKAGRMTSSPAQTPAARKASTKASEPFEQATTWATPK